MDKQLEYIIATNRRHEEMMRPDTPNHEYESAWQCYRQENYKEAAELFEKSAEKYLAAEGLDSLDYARALFALGQTYIDLADEASTSGDEEVEQALYSKEQKLFLDVQSIYERHEKTDKLQRELSIVYTVIGDNYSFLKEYDEALKWRKKAVDICECVLGTEHQDTAASYNNMGHLFNALQKYDEALEWYHKARVINERVLGMTHPQTALDYGNISCMYENKNDFNTALEWQVKCYRMMVEYDEDESYLNYELKKMRDTYKKANPRQLFHRPKGIAFKDWLHEKLSVQSESD